MVGAVAEVTGATWSEETDAGVLSVQYHFDIREFLDIVFRALSLQLRPSARSGEVAIQFQGTVLKQVQIHIQNHRKISLGTGSYRDTFQNSTKESFDTHPARKLTKHAKTDHL